MWLRWLRCASPCTATQVVITRNYLNARISCTSSENQHSASLVQTDDFGASGLATSITSSGSAAGMRQDRESLQMQEALQWLSVVIFNEGKRRALLELRDDNAQSMIDYLNALLSHPDLVEPKLRKHILIVLRKLCENSMLYPSCYPLDGIENISLICAGGFCDIYQGRYQGKTLCLKVVRLYQKGDQDQMLKAHAREAILWNQLKHPNVTPFYGIFYLQKLQKRISLLSPWMENGNIVGYLKGNPQLPRKQFLYDIISGLEYLHNENIVHGDLKGANVLVDGSSIARLADFGLSKILTDATLGFLDTSDGITGLTTNWASPELLEEHARPTRESDIWAFGCVCYEILTGLSPFHGCTGIQAVRKLIDRKLPAQPVNDRLDPNTAVNKKIWSLVKQCWSFEIVRRPGCSEILQEMKNDTLVWQIRAEGSNCESQLSKYTVGITNPILDHNQARRLLEITGTGMDREESRIVNDRHLGGDQVSFVNQFFTTSPRSLRIDYSLPPLPNSLQPDTLDVTGVPGSASLCPPAAIHPSPSRPSFRFPSPEGNMDDQREDRREMNEGESQIVGNNHLCGLSSCLQFLCCRRYYSRPQPSLANRPFVHGVMNNATILTPSARPANRIDVVEPIEMYYRNSLVAQLTPDLPVLVSPSFSSAPQRSGSLRRPYLRPRYSSEDPSLESRNPGRPSYSPPEQYQAQSMVFHQAPDFILSNPIMINNSSTISDRFMENLLRNTIPGVEFDSSARHPPPRCHTGTRLDIIERCLHFIANCSGVKKVRWVFGAAGVGKSAIMQSVAESPELPVSPHASVFLSVNERDDGAKVIVSLCYQFASKSDRYRQFVKRELMHDPSLLLSSMSRQFNRFIVEPFISRSELGSAGPISVIIDGLDECEDRTTQLELLRLISEFCISYPSSPLVWLISSRPEQHITSFFSTHTVQLVYEKEEILADSDDSCEDVKLFLRNELRKIKRGSHLLNLQSEWPKERDFLALTKASEGLFAYAHSIIDYIGNPTVENPVSRLCDVLKVIDNHPMPDMPGGEHPMDLLDALYARILSNVPPEVMGDTRTLLLALVSEWDWFLYPGESNFIVLCNWLAMAPNDAYAALFPLFAVLRVPEKHKAPDERVKFFHKSFIDYISDFSRSRLFLDIHSEVRQLQILCTSRILREAPNGFDFGSIGYESFFGDLARSHGTGDMISLTWTIDEEAEWDDHETRLSMYKTAIGWVIDGIRSRELAFQSQFFIRVLTTRFKRYDYFPYDELSDSVFDESRRYEFTKDGLLKQVPLEAINFSNLDKYVRLRFHCPVSSVTDRSDPWNSTCTHKRKGEWEEGKKQDWTTNIPKGCTFCWERFEQQLDSWRIQTSNLTVPILFSSTGKCCVELKFVDSKVDSSSGPVWAYRLCVELSLEERKKYGSTV